MSITGSAGPAAPSPGARYLVAVTRSVALTALAVAGLVTVATTLAGLVLGFVVGAVFLFRPLVALNRGLTGLQRDLSERWSGIAIPAPYRTLPDRSVLTDPATWRDLLWLLLDPVVAAPVTIGCLLFGYASGPQLVRAHSAWAHTLLRPPDRAVLSERVADLTKSRTEVADAQASELRRVERDLHDGAQSRIVAMGMMLDSAEQIIDRDVAAAKQLLSRARDTSRQALEELRKLVRGIHPPILAERGLADAVRALALNSPMPVEVAVDLPGRPEPPIESAAYFAVAEVLTNVAKHAGAQHVFVDLGYDDGVLRITVVDDGQGGADPSRGSGLRGIQRRLSVFDGTLTIASPAGGPTVLTVELRAPLTVRP